MSDHRLDAEKDERSPGSIPKVSKHHLRDHAKTWIRSIRREPQKPDEKGALAIVVLAGGDRLALYPDQGDLLRVRELDR